MLVFDEGNLRFSYRYGRWHVVLDNGGRILAYGAVLDPKKKGRLRGTEGSRTKAAIGASNYGLAIKISSDGDITVYHDGEKFIRM